MVSMTGFSILSSGNSVSGSGTITRLAANSEVHTTSVTQHVVRVGLGLRVLDHLLALRVGVRGKLDEPRLLVRVRLVPVVEDALDEAGGVLALDQGDRAGTREGGAAGGGTTAAPLHRLLTRRMWWLPVQQPWPCAACAAPFARVSVPRCGCDRDHIRRTGLFLPCGAAGVHDRRSGVDHAGPKVHWVRRSVRTGHTRARTKDLPAHPAVWRRISWHRPPTYSYDGPRRPGSGGRRGPLGWTGCANRYRTTLSSISVTSAAIGERSERCSVTWAKSGCPLSRSTTATMPS